MIKNLEIYNDFKQMLNDEAKNIKNYLEKDPFFLDKGITFSLSGGKGSVESYNSRDIYKFVNVKRDNVEVAFITLYLNEIDSDSGNFHTQFGKIQFWVAGNPHSYKENSSSEGYSYIEENKDMFRNRATIGNLLVNFSKSYNPQISIYQESYLGSLNDEFKKFINVKRIDAGC